MKLIKNEKSRNFTWVSALRELVLNTLRRFLQIRSIVVVVGATSLLKWVESFLVVVM